MHWKMFYFLTFISNTLHLLHCKTIHPATRQFYSSAVRFLRWQISSSFSTHLTRSSSNKLRSALLPCCTHKISPGPPTSTPNIPSKRCRFCPGTWCTRSAVPGLESRRRKWRFFSELRICNHPRSFLKIKKYLRTFLKFQNFI